MNITRLLVGVELLEAIYIHYKLSQKESEMAQRYLWSFLGTTGVGRRGHVGDPCATVGQEKELTGEARAASNHSGRVVECGSANCA